MTTVVIDVGIGGGENEVTAAAKKLDAKSIALALHATGSEA